MRTARFHQFGEPAEVLRLEDLPVPEPAAGDVRVRMLASPINPSDLMHVRGVYGKRPSLPAGVGFEGVGVVEAAGGGMFGRFLVGKRVAVMNRAGGNWAERVVLSAKRVIPLDSELPVEQAAMFFVNPAAAWVMTRRVLAVPQGEWLLQTAAGSALGKMVIRLARHEGFRTLNVVRREEQVEELQALGADRVVAFDPDHHEPARLREQVLEATGGRGVKFAIDPVGGRTGSAAVGCLGDEGRMLVYGTLSDEPLNFSPRTLMTAGAKVEGFWLSRWMEARGLFARLSLVRTITRLMKADIFVSEVAAEFPLDQLTAALRAAEQPARGGKILLRLGEP
ncbi:MAG: zinc-dependent alcohol dehydrogenase family protein [Planctomycetaceae bacterium]